MDQFIGTNYSPRNVQNWAKCYCLSTKIWPYEFGNL